MEHTQAPRWVGGVEPAPELLAATGAEIMELECREQPELLRGLLRAYSTDPEIRWQLAEIRELCAAPGPVLFLGMGGSLCSSYGGSVPLHSQGRMAFSMDAGEWLHYATCTWDQAALSVLLTTSGESAELVELVQAAGNRPLALICNNTASPCWRMTRRRLPILAGPEYGNATKTYTNSTAAAIIMACEVLGQDWRRDAETAAEAFSSSLERIFAQRNELEAFCRGAANTEIVGRGAAYGGAVMSALCIREMSGHRAAAHTGAGFRHGPNLDVDATHVAIVLALGRRAELGVKLAGECARKGGKVILVSEQERAATTSIFPVRLDPVAEPWEGLTSIITAQALTLAMIERNGCRLPPRFQYGPMEQ
jgi:glucosamine--fructose-6-phosphate aminotransferase (isomerizing)